MNTKTSQPDICEQANALYALGEAFIALEHRHPSWTLVVQKTPCVGDLVIVTCMFNPNPMQHVGRLVFSGPVLIPEWGPVETWDPRDQEDYRNGTGVGTQHEWEIECLDGERRRFTNVRVTRLPKFADIPRYY